MNITNEQLIRNRIEMLQRISLNAGALIAIERNNCTHKFVPDVADAPNCSSPVCIVCGYEGFGWYCPDNLLTHECDYTQEDGTYNDDMCIHCGNPEERK